VYDRGEVQASNKGFVVGLPPVVKSDILSHTRAIVEIQELEGTPYVLSSGWDGLIKKWKRCEPSEKDPLAIWWTLVWQVSGKSPLLLDDENLLCVGWADMANPNSLWIWNLKPTPPPEGWKESPPGREWPFKSGPREDQGQRPKQYLRSHKKLVTGLLELDKGQIISYSEDSTFQLWSRKFLTPKLLYAEHTGPVMKVIQLKHGRYAGALVSASWDKTARVWPNPKFFT